MKTKRTLAIEWWNKLADVDKYAFQKAAGLNRTYNSLTGREIEKVYNFINKHNALECKQLAESHQHLVTACEWAMDVMTRLNEAGKYPDFLLAENGGEGLKPLVDALKNAKEVKL